MANAFYPKWKEALLQNAADSTLDGTVKAVLVDTATYTYSATHEFLSDIPVGERVAISAALGSKTYTNGTFDAADGVTFTGVTGDQAEALVFFIDTGNAATSRLIAFFDTGVTNLPVTPNGGDVTLNFNASGILTI